VARITNPQAAVSKLESILIDAGKDVAAGLDAAFSQKIASPEYLWLRETRRRNGSTVRSPRNIIDTGRLDASQRLERPSATEWRWVWDASNGGFQYPLLVHEGATLSNGGEYSARPWTKRATEEYRPTEKFAQEVKRRV
jgi:hypothetical protein